MRTASESFTPAWAHTVVRFSRHWRAWSPIEPSTSAPVAGSIGTWPEQNSRPAERTADLYGPAGGGAAGAGGGGGAPAGVGASCAVKGFRCDTVRASFPREARPDTTAGRYRCARVRSRSVSAAL